MQADPSAHQTPGRSVRDDWRSGLPEPRQRLFAAVLGPLEAGYTMLSVAVDEAFGLRRNGTLVQAREQVGISVELARRLALQLHRVIGALSLLTRRSRFSPAVAPLHPEHFHWPTLRRAAAWESLLESLVPTAGLRFRLKAAILGHLVERAAADFRHAAREISEGSSVHPESHWEALEALHHDLSTCLGETLILTKSLLLGLPESRLEDFHRLLEGALLPVAGTDARLSHSSA
jgi:hypothetical protein